MQESMVIQGRHVTPQDIQWIRRLIEDDRSWHRKRFSIEICQLWNWRTANGRLKDMALDRHDTPLACFLFGAAVAGWKIAPRDAFIDCDAETRRRNLHLLTNNMRFLILPWIRVPHLASHLLGQVARRICADWRNKYGHPIYLLETFVECERFRGV